VYLNRIQTKKIVFKPNRNRIQSVFKPNRNRIHNRFMALLKKRVQTIFNPFSWWTLERV